MLIFLIMLILLILSKTSQAPGICHSTYERLYLKTHPKLKGTPPAFAYTNARLSISPRTGFP